MLHDMAEAHTKRIDGSRSIVLVTGASGFLGKHIMSELKSARDQLTIVPWDRELFGDLLSDHARTEALARLRPDAVIHLAWAHTGSKDYEYSDENFMWAEASSRFAQECVERRIWFLAAGSAADLPNDPTFTSPYSFAKRSFRASVEALQGETTWFSPQFVFSLQDARPRILNAFLAAGSDSSFVLSEPHRCWDFIHVDDVARGVKTILIKRLTGSLYVGTGIYRSNLDLLTAAKAHAAGTRLRRKLSPPRMGPLAPEALIRELWEPISTNLFFEGV